MALRDELDKCQGENLRLTQELASQEVQIAALKHSRIQLYLAYATGVAFVSVLLLLALYVNNPTLWQYTLFRTILSLAAAGIAAILPGDIEIRYKNLVRATGAMAVFFLVYRINPVSLAGIEPPLPTQSFQFKILSKQEEKAALNCFTLPFSDVTSVVNQGRLFQTIGQFAQNYANIKFDPAAYLTLRRSDETALTKDQDVLAPRNDGLILIDKSLLAKPDNRHLLFTMANTMSCRQ